MKKIFQKLWILLVIVSIVTSVLFLVSFKIDEDNLPVFWYYGTKKPKSNTPGNVGDFYFKYDTCDVYTLTDDGWEKAFNMKGKNGKKGTDGTNWLSGRRVPMASDGENGDFWLNTSTLTLYEKKNGEWFVMTRFTSDRTNAYNPVTDSDGRLKVLCIGNSYTNDTSNYAYDILKDLGIENVTVARLYIANCKVQEHYANLMRSEAEYEANPPTTEDGNPVKRWRYTYTVNSTGKWETSYNYYIKDALLEGDWDIITFQHTSSGVLDEDAVTVLGQLADEVRKYCPDAVFHWNMTWSPQNENTDKQIEKYEAIVESTKTNIVPDPDFAFVSPIGTAIQNARSSSLGDTMNRDGSHLSYGMGRYTAALAYVGAITGLDISEVTWRPSEYTVSEKEYKIAIESAVNALNNPFEITQSKY